MIGLIVEIHLDAVPALHFTWLDIRHQRSVQFRFRAGYESSFEKQSSGYTTSDADSTRDFAWASFAGKKRCRWHANSSLKEIEHQLTTTGWCKLTVSKLGYTLAGDMNTSTILGIDLCKLVNLHAGQAAHPTKRVISPQLTQRCNTRATLLSQLRY